MNPNNKIPFVDRIREYCNNAIHWRGGGNQSIDDDDQLDFSKSFEQLLEENRQKQKMKNENDGNNCVPISSRSSCSSRYKTCNDIEDDSLELVANKTTETYDSYKTTNQLPPSNECSGYGGNQSDGDYNVSDASSGSNNNNNINNQTDAELAGIEKLSIQSYRNDEGDDENGDIIPVVEPTLDDTLEVVEYIPNESKYVLKPLSINKPSDTSINLRRDFNIFSNTTAKMMAHSFSTDTFNNSDLAIKDKNDQTIDDVIDLTNDGVDEVLEAVSCDDEEVIEVVPEEDDEGIEVVPEEDNDEGIKILPNDDSFNTDSDFDYLKSDKSDESLKKLDESFTIPTNFNDSLERMEFMMKRGEELLKKQMETPEATNINQTKSPMIKTPRNFASPNLISNKTSRSHISSPILKQHNFCDSPKKNPSSPFKKPQASLITPGVIRKPPAHHQQPRGIPKLKMSHLAKQTTPSQFSHIKSPISVYINNRQIPTVQNVYSVEKKRLEFFSKNPQSSETDENETDENLSLDFTILNTKINNASKLPTKLPIKTHIKATTQLVTDLRDEVVPGGQKIKSLFGTEPTITRHLGHIGDGPTQQILDNTVVETNHFMDVSIVERPNIQRY